MGLDWRVSTGNIGNTDENTDDELSTALVSRSISSYGGFQEIRKAWIRAAIIYLKEIKKSQRRMILQDFFSTLIVAELVSLICEMAVDLNEPTIFSKWISKYGEIDYKKVVETDQIENLQGLWLFLNHSDCDGVHTPNQSKCILDTFKLINEFSKKDLHHYNAKTLTYMLKLSIKYSTNVVYC